LVSSLRLVSESKKPPQLRGARGQVFVFLFEFFDHKYSNSRERHVSQTPRSTNGGVEW